MKPKQKKSAVVTVNSVTNALAVLRRLAAAHRPEGVSAIARGVGISASQSEMTVEAMATACSSDNGSCRKTTPLATATIGMAIEARPATWAGNSFTSANQAEVPSAIGMAPV